MLSISLRPFAALALLASLIGRPDVALADPVALPFGVGLEIDTGDFAARGSDLSEMLRDDDRLAALVSPVSGLSEERQLDYVQAVIGQMIAWRSDRQLYGAADRWAGPRETLARRAGDCEDIAILKLASLANLGIDQKRLALVIGRDRARGDHAIAAIRTVQGWRLLDDGSAVRLPASYAAFDPTYVLTAGSAFLVGREQGVQTAAR